MPPSQLARSQDEIEQLIDRQIKRGSAVLEEAKQVTDQESYKRWTHEAERWDALTAEGLRAMYVDDEPSVEFHEAATGGLFRFVDQDEDDTFKYRQEAIERGIHVLASLRERLEYAVPARDAPASPQSEGSAHVPSTRKVFVVHGRDEGLRARVARVLEKLDFEPVVLSEQPWQGRTVIEKFEDHSSEAEFAVVILSADDWGRGPDDSDWPNEPNRARQNVVLELGYFMGRLGRRYVAALLGPGVEQPSDIAGLGYSSLAESDWPWKLGAELAAAGFDVDLNRLPS